MWPSSAAKPDDGESSCVNHRMVEWDSGVTSCHTNSVSGSESETLRCTEKGKDVEVLMSRWLFGKNSVLQNAQCANGRGEPRSFAILSEQGKTGKGRLGNKIGRSCDQPGSMPEKRSPKRQEWQLLLVAIENPGRYGLSQPEILAKVESCFESPVLRVADFVKIRSRPRDFSGDYLIQR